MSPQPDWIVERVVSRVSTATAWIGGGSFLLLALYMTVDVLGRRYGGFYSGVTDEISAYFLAVAGTLGLAHALRIGAHVRVDLLLPIFPPGARYFLNLGNIALIGLFAGLLSWYGWIGVLYSLEMDARSISVLRAPLAIPQGLMALNFTLLAVQALAMTLGAIIRLHALGTAAWATRVPGDADAAAEEIRGA